ncbi:hypothetical protein TNCV_1986031 [Trichonephila clavipes]|nr:hypothetical protein TNCV_1986031 [Trichonephila clavipes]
MSLNELSGSQARIMCRCCILPSNPSHRHQRVKGQIFPNRFQLPTKYGKCVMFHHMCETTPCLETGNALEDSMSILLSPQFSNHSQNSSPRGHMSGFSNTES